MHQPLPLLKSLGHRLAAGLLELRQAVMPEEKPYRPERHYMRGPGPKWREKHPVARHR